MGELGMAVVRSNNEMQAVWIFSGCYVYELIYYICWDQFHIPANQAQGCVAFMSDRIEDLVITNLPDW